MDQNVTTTEMSTKKTVGHFSKFKYVYIYILSALLIAGLLFGAFHLDMNLTENTETENEKKEGYISAIGFDIEALKNQKIQEIDEELQKQLNKEAAFLMLISLDEYDERVLEYANRSTVWARMTRTYPELAQLAANRFGFTGEAYDALHTFFFDKDTSGIEAITPVGVDPEAYLQNLNDARDIVENKEKDITRPLDKNDPKDKAKIDTIVNWYVLSSLIWNPSAAPDNDSNFTNTADAIGTISGISRIITLLVVMVALLIVVAKSTGQYSLGISFPEQSPWMWGTLAALPLLGFALLYSMMGNIQSTLYLVAMVCFMAVFIAFGCFAFRKAGAGKALRVFMPLVITYACVALFIFLTSNFQHLIEYAKDRVDHFTSLEIMTFELPHAVFFTLFLVAPLFMAGAYILTNSLVAMVVPTLFVTGAASFFPGIMQTVGAPDSVYLSTKMKVYVVIFLAVLAVYLITTVWLYISIIRKLVKKIPLPSDMLCEHYAEGSPEVTFPEAYLAAKEAKKEKKEKKASEKGDFAFLNDSDKTK
ncbi:MAG: hypothetical protein IKC63_00915 [Clostridia bacterium]|nr:hypothetical protein [Clostridia bacterium]